MEGLRPRNGSGTTVACPGSVGTDWHSGGTGGDTSAGEGATRRGADARGDGSSRTSGQTRLKLAAAEVTPDRRRGHHSQCLRRRAKGRVAMDRLAALGAILVVVGL